VQAEVTEWVGRVPPLVVRVDWVSGGRRGRECAWLGWQTDWVSRTNERGAGTAARPVDLAREDGRWLALLPIVTVRSVSCTVL
jgi:hypothetical protein